jgi:hypothetical protein
MMETVSTSEEPVNFYHTTRRYNPEYGRLHTEPENFPFCQFFSLLSPLFHLLLSAFVTFMIHPFLAFPHFSYFLLPCPCLTFFQHIYSSGSVALLDWKSAEISNRKFWPIIVGSLMILVVPCVTMAPGRDVSLFLFPCWRKGATET